MFQKFRSSFFSEIIEKNVDVLSFCSPNGLNFGYALQCQLIILDVDSQKLVQKFICDYPIDTLGWSPDSELIYCCMKKQGTIQVWNTNNPLWRCKITENPLAVSEVYWAPDSRHLLVISEFHLKMTVWSLVSTTTAVIESPKPVKNCVSFSNCEKYLAVAERRKCEDFISIHTCDTWEILKFFPVETKDLSGIYFSPTELVIGVLESFSVEPKVMFYSIDGRILGKYIKFSMFGFTCFSWSKDGKHIVIGDYFGTVTFLSSSTYDEIVSYPEIESIDCEKTTVYKMNPKPVDHEASGHVSSNMEFFQVLNGKPFVLASLAAHEKIKPKQAKYGIKTLSFSSCGKYLLSLNDSFPKVLIVFDLVACTLSSVVLYHQKIEDVSWHPVDPLLVISCGSQNVDLWAPTCCISLCSPFTDKCPIIRAEWCPKKSCLLLNARSHSVLLYLPEAQENFFRTNASSVQGGD